MQLQIIEKLEISKATVSMYVGKFSTLAELQCFEAAGKGYGIMDQVEALHNLAAELKEAKLTVEEARIGLKMVHLPDPLCPVPGGSLQKGSSSRVVPG